MSEISDLVKETWTVLQPFLPIIAGKAAEEIGKTTVGKVWVTIEKKFKAKSTAKEILEDLCKNPHSADLQASFRYQLKKLLEEDNSFVSELSNLLESTGSKFKAQVIGGGAVAQGNNAKAVGIGGILIEGGVNDSNITAGDKNMNYK
jgi:hypothetical protein